MVWLALKNHMDMCFGMRMEMDMEGCAPFVRTHTTLKHNIPQVSPMLIAGGYILCYILHLTCIINYSIIIIDVHYINQTSFLFSFKVCEQCPNVKYEREGNFITVDIGKGMQDGQLSTYFYRIHIIS